MNAPSSLWVKRLHGARRVREVLAVLTRHGLADLADELRWSRRSRSRAQPTGAASSGPPGPPTPRRLRLALEELGPTFVKLGQALCTRSDLLPEAWLKELRQLRERVSTIPFAQIEGVIDASLGAERQTLFAHIDPEPLAAGSIAQIHRGTLADGTAVALKVVRPGARRRIDADIEIMELLARLIERRSKNLGFDPTDLVHEFARSIRRETDMVHEGQSTDRFRRLFADDQRVAFPEVFWEASTAEVLALELFDGPTLSRIEPEDLDPALRRNLVRAGADAVFRQCLEIGFFHSDPHPGNLMALRDGRLGFVDCGQVGQIDAATAQYLAELVAGVVGKDADRVMDATIELAQVDPAMASDRGLRRTVDDIIMALDAGSLERLDIGHVLSRFFDGLREHAIVCPGDLLLLIKALTTIEAVAEWLAPEFDVLEHTRPHIERLIERRYSPGALFQRFTRGLLAYSDLLEQLPHDLQVLVQRLKRNELRLRVDHLGLRRLTLTLEYSSRVIAFALVIGSMIVGSAILALADRTSGAQGVLTKIAVAGALTSLVLAVLLVITHRRPRE